MPSPYTTGRERRAASCPVAAYHSRRAGNGQRHAFQLVPGLPIDRLAMCLIACIPCCSTSSVSFEAPSPCVARNSQLGHKDRDHWLNIDDLGKERIGVHTAPPLLGQLVHIDRWGCNLREKD
jgi:hypothetical protein